MSNPVLKTINRHAKISWNWHFEEFSGDGENNVIPTIVWRYAQESNRLDNAIKTALSFCKDDLELEWTYSVTSSNPPTHMIRPKLFEDYLARNANLGIAKAEVQFSRHNRNVVQIAYKDIYLIAEFIKNAIDESHGIT